MDRIVDERAVNNTPISQISFDELRKKQSVRATFKLPQESIDLLGIVAGQLGIKQKSLLDKLVEDTSLLHRLAEQTSCSPAEDEPVRRQKTYVISRSSLRSINDIAKQQNIPRDILVEMSIKRLLPIIETELEKHIHRKLILQEMKSLSHLGEDLLDKTRSLLGGEDVLYGLLEKQLDLVQKNISAADSIVEKGMPMENW
jgi:hypothetical protein